ncbi:septal ring lytic transglycosylase RlpA family protein [Legionella bononiensis]|uniref:Endolytic peptidoglycan transglycosylase RlpA n=1 Tax=Legionella bononiensis TaxID=2793102 RepID=A0ABS1W6K4_9GAMM|nr:septal ring lytic transglycosylase RlpA family protein [Legionella bononiensis]MBL7478387.1 septal ring lytic transglycosylase RlpA family protein [Legionella bononiensis]MBL7524984.1 septal ring lytic transglycosylase RlpA family protein [Legionella bononiensis]MBL7561281.1 septal ring lytic transglycosylase RlpA family protein [Legionella bononiensis]
MNYNAIFLNIYRLITVLLPMLLVACTHQQANGPDHYVIKGKTYHVMKSAKNYKAKGIASWYGSHPRHQKTSSGERFNKYAMTAAHPTLPIATRVRVKNLNNGKSIIVRINDRGPFLSNRIIDLSFGAAKKLGIKGLAPVEIEVV